MDQVLSPPREKHQSFFYFKFVGHADPQVKFFQDFSHFPTARRIVFRFLKFFPTCGAAARRKAEMQVGGCRTRSLQRFTRDVVRQLRFPLFFSDLRRRRLGEKRWGKKELNIFFGA